MSISIIILGYWNQKEGGMPTSEVLELFGKSPNNDLEGVLAHDEKTYCEYSITQENNAATVISIDRPYGHHSLYELLFELLKRGPYMLFSPEGRIVPVVARSDMPEHLPENVIEAFGIPVVVTDGASLSSTLFG
ncbi:hypothetical protein [Roseovarius rhodophyticola]|uniref:Uncharacterized protein n=1 Tax=Roseovarius rhodophyticola TaxID=3080827 RepID=A0ABZ2THL5_9RHOB|nr:hypothetical protein [Roseovarius sp. W115]MDV2929503.1 hypothetical protein [Roseovarius sp. W115]